MATTPDIHTRAEIPEVIGDYELLLPIGSGGMGCVYLARKRVVGDVYREFALKLMRPQIEPPRLRSGVDDARADWTRLLVEEAKIAARMRHPNVVSVLEVAEGPWGVCLVMDYVEGPNLATLSKLAASRQRDLPLRVVARIMQDALAGLHAVHELRDTSGAPLHIVHRDISPQNLVIGVDGTTRLTDFGIAKARDRPDTTDHGSIKGKLRYMAPEQARGHALDRRVDVWAAGVVAWEAISGERLFQGDTDAETLLRVISAPAPRPLCELRPEVPAEVDEAVASALVRDRDQRCPSALELSRRLDAAWRAADAVADPREVAAWVREIAGDELTDRRRRVHQAALARAQVAEPSAPSVSKLRSRGAGPVDDAAPAATAEETRTANVVDARRGHGSRWAPAAAVVLLGGLGALAVYGRDLRPASLGPAARPGLGALIPRDRPPSESVQAASAPAPRLLEVHADAALREVTVDDRHVLLGRPSETARVQLPENAAGPLRIEVVAVDGRRAERTVTADATEVSFELGAARPRSQAPKPTSDRRLLPYKPSDKGSP